MASNFDGAVGGNIHGFHAGGSDAGGIAYSAAPESAEGGFDPWHPSRMGGGVSPADFTRPVTEATAGLPPLQVGDPLEGLSGNMVAAGHPSFSADADVLHEWARPGTGNAPITFYGDQANFMRNVGSVVNLDDALDPTQARQLGATLGGMEERMLIAGVPKESPLLQAVHSTLKQMRSPEGLPLTSHDVVSGVGAAMAEDADAAKVAIMPEDAKVLSEVIGVLH